MKYEEIPGYVEVREELKDARIVLLRSSTDKEKEEAQLKVKEIRYEMAKLMSEYRSGGKER